MATYWFNRDNIHEVLDKAIIDINNEIYPDKVKTVRVFERGRSIEDFSISYYKNSIQPIFNFYLITPLSSVNLTIQKKAKGSSRHISINMTEQGNITFDNSKKKKVIELNFVNDVYYTDGTHRYNK